MELKDNIFVFGVSLTVACHLLVGLADEFQHTFPFPVRGRQRNMPHNLAPGEPVSSEKKAMEAPFGFQHCQNLMRVPTKKHLLNACT